MQGLYFPLVNVMILLIAGLAYSGEIDSSLPNPYVITYPFKSAVITTLSKTSMVTVKFLKAQR